LAAPEVNVPSGLFFGIFLSIPRIAFYGCITSQWMLRGSVMAITLFVVVGAAVSLGALFVMATQAATRPALAGDNTVVGLADPSAETLRTDSPARPRADWQLATVTNLTDAEDLLDSLEAHGCEDRELVVLGNSCFAVRWR
jgi:hypothetical protein